MGDDLGLARRSGALILGFDQISKALAGKSPPRLLIEAADGAADGRRKLLGVAFGAWVHPQGVGLPQFSGIELGPGPRECGTCSPQIGAAGGTAYNERGAARGLPHSRNEYRQSGSDPRWRKARMSETNDTTRRAQDAVAEEDGDIDRQAELQPWPHQGRRGGKEARARGSGAAAKPAAAKPKRRQSPRSRLPQPAPASIRLRAAWCCAS